MREMKDSGLQWAEKIPKTWMVKKGKYFLNIQTLPVREDDGVITCFRDGEVTLRSNRREEGFTISTTEAGYQGINQGDLIVHGMDGFAGAIGISDSRGKATPVLNNLETAENKRYMMYELRAMAFCELFQALSTGIRVRTCDTNWGKLRAINYFLPPITEQKRIAAFLDSKCAEIDALSADIQSEIDTLEAYKRSVITEAVTKGLDRSVPMKDSGIEWVGEIPAHWGVEKVKYHLQRYELRNPGDQQILSVYREYGVIPKDSRDDNHNVTSEDTSKYKYVRPGYLVINKMKAWQGSMGVSAYEGVVSPAYFIYRFTDKLLVPQYLHYLFRSCYKDEFRRISGGIREGQWDLSPEAFANTLILLPQVEEQIEIITYIDSKVAEIDSIIAQKREQLDVLADYKKSIIYEYVTGKKEVV